MKLSLGTAQFGLDYGIANVHGKATEFDVHSIIEAAHSAGIQFLDTAHLYGSSEAVLGKVLGESYDFKLITKTPQSNDVQISSGYIKSVADAFNQSLRLLGVNSLHGLLVHNGADLLKPGGVKLWEKLLELKQRKLVEKIGVSVYSPTELESILDNYHIDIAQFPVSVLDQRFLNVAIARRLRETNVKTFARSIYLQGALFLTSAKVEQKIGRRAVDYIASFQRCCETYSIPPQLLALKFIETCDVIYNYVVGAESQEQFKQNIALAHEAKQLDLEVDFSKFLCEDNSVIDPRCWKC